VRKTTVYLSDEEVEGLRRVSAETGASQSDLIRRGLRTVLGEPSTKRVFHSMGKGASGGGRLRRWTSEELYEKAFGRR
jgi:hypothetical protein